MTTTSSSSKRFIIHPSVLLGNTVCGSVVKEPPTSSQNQSQKIQSTNSSPPETSSTVPVTYGLVMRKTAACPTSAAVPSRRAGKFARTFARISSTVAAGRTSQKSVSMNPGRIVLTREQLLAAENIMKRGVPLAATQSNITQTVEIRDRRREIDAIVVWRLDRWGRSVADLMTTLRELLDLSVGFVSLTEALDLTTPSGRAMAGMLAIFAEFEREILREILRKSGIAQSGWCSFNSASFAPPSPTISSASSCCPPRSPRSTPASAPAAATTPPKLPAAWPRPRPRSPIGANSTTSSSTTPWTTPSPTSAPSFAPGAWPPPARPASPPSPAPS